MGDSSTAECFGLRDTPELTEGDLGYMPGLAVIVGTDEGVSRIYSFRCNAKISLSFSAVNSAMLFGRERTLLASLLEGGGTKLPVLDRRLIFAFLRVSVPVPECRGVRGGT